MELREFINKTLVSISQGVMDANDNLPSIVAELSRFGFYGKTHHLKGTQGDFIDFDIAVEVSEAKENGANGKIGVAVIDLGGESKTTTSQQNQHRLKFSVFVTEK